MYFVFFVISRPVATYFGILGFWNSFLCQKSHRSLRSLVRFLIRQQLVRKIPYARTFYLHNFKQWLKIICFDKGYGKIIESECEATFTVQQTNFRPAEKFDRTLPGTLRSNDADSNENVKKQ